MSWWSTTGRHWRRPPRQCPPWCGGGHQCTAQHGYPSGEHRSAPLRIALDWGVLVATRVQGMDGHGRLEVRLQVVLSDSELVAHAQAAAVAGEIDVAIRSALLSAGWVDVDEPDLLGLPRV